jgi:biotin carboxyl carrier protein
MAYLWTMFTALADGKEYKAVPGKQRGTFVIDGKEVTADIVHLHGDTYHLLVENASFTVELVRAEPGEKSYEIRVNDSRHTVRLRDPYDELLQRLGMDAAAHHKIHQLKAPMPGMVVAVHVTDGQEVKVGDVLVSLEAMKMENTLKAAGDGTVAQVMVKKGQAVEKNEVLIRFS